MKDEMALARMQAWITNAGVFVFGTRG